MVKKEIDQDRFFWNPKTGKKIFSHYSDGREIVLGAKDKEDSVEARKQCIMRSIAKVEASPASRSKKPERRGRPPKKEELAKVELPKKE